MKKIINIHPIIVLINFVVDFLFACKLMFEINYYKKDKILNINHIRVLLQFMGRSFDFSSFEFYNIGKEDNLYIFYLSLKKHNSFIFQIFCFFHCFIFNQLFYNFVWDILPNNKIGIEIRCKILNKIWGSVNYFILRRVNNNFGYHYLVEYRKYYNDDIDFYKHIRYKVFFWESLINITCWWNNICIKYHLPKFVINNDNLFYKAENYF